MKLKLIFIVSFFIVFFSQEVVSQENSLLIENSEKLNVKIINAKTSIKSSMILNDDSGVIIGGEGSFAIDKKSTLTIATKLTILQHKQLFYGNGKVLFESGSVDYVDVTWFGATPNDETSDVIAIQKAIDAAIMSQGVSIVYFPPGEYCIDSSLFAVKRNTLKNNYELFNLTLRGHQLAYNNPKGKKGGVSVLKVDKEIPFALGIQGARGVHIENMVFDGFMKQKTSIEDLIEKPSNSIYKQPRYAPVSAIVIDPFSNKKTEGKGYNELESYYNNRYSSSRILIEGSVIQNFPTGISISPNGKTKQADSIAINFTRFYNLINGIVICQAQSRNIVVDNCSFHRMKFAFNTDDFGEQQGVLPEVNNIKVADGVAWIYKANGNIAYGHFRNVYAESLYGIGYSVLNKQPLNFESCVFKFRPVLDPSKHQTNPCIIKADNASFTGCTFTYGGGKSNIEPLIFDIKKATYINCYFDSYPINIGSKLNNKNTSDNYSSNLRKIKLKTTSWDKDKFNTTVNVPIKYDVNRKSFQFKNDQSLKKGDFVFGYAKLNKEPFNNNLIFTVLGKVNEVSKTNIYFKSSVLDTKLTSVKMNKN